MVEQQSESAHHWTHHSFQWGSAFEDHRCQGPGQRALHLQSSQLTRQGGELGHPEGQATPQSGLVNIAHFLFPFFAL